tara:strand:+ start:83 stop:601 length:519 start_codon:yes stop_codon:yes gene_type:complete
MSERKFIPLSIAVLVVSDSRTEKTDKSGKLINSYAEESGHLLAEKTIVRDDIYEIRATVSRWISDPKVQVIISTGGTGVTGRDGTPEAIEPLLDKTISGFGEIFRAVSFDEIGTSSLQSRAIAGVSNGTYIFCLPGSASACKTAWNALIKSQLDYRTRPCNLVELMPRLTEL